MKQTRINRTLTSLLFSLFIFSVLFLNPRSALGLLELPTIQSHVTTSYTEHDPIIIISDDNFTDYGFTGNGIDSDPYIIENLLINSTSENGIVINGTFSHFIIRNCYVETSQVGIYILGVANGTTRIYNNYLVGNEINGIVIVETSFFWIIGNSGHDDKVPVRVHECTNGYVASNSHMGGENIGYLRSAGIYITNSQDCVLFNNSFDYYNRGIYALNCSNLIIQQNYFSNSKEQAGIYLYETNLCFVFNNTVINSIEVGIKLWEASFNRIVFNQVSNNGFYGLASFYSINLIYLNNFVENGFVADNVSQGWESGISNIWCDLNLKKGNHWSDLESDVYVIENSNNLDPYPFNHPVTEDDLDSVTYPTPPIIITIPGDAEISETNALSSLLIFISIITISVVFLRRKIKS